MTEYLLQFDRKLFFFINHTLSNRFFDWLMPYMRYPQFWIPVYVIIVVFCLMHYKWRGAIIIVMLAITVGIADFGSAGVIKPAVKRLRPCRDSLIAKTDISRVPCGTGYSFPSTHASDHFAIAIFLIAAFYKRWRRVWLWCLLWACLVCFAQVYVGLHYPLDVFGGAVFGSLIGYLFGGPLLRKLIPAF